MAALRWNWRGLGAGRRAPAGGLGFALAAAVAAGGCETSDPNRALTDEEGAALVERVRSEQSRPDDLTMQEKKWLRGYLAR